MEKVLAVALSGGVDSTVAALVLREHWKRLVGATHFIWPNSRCCSLPVFKRAEFLARQLSLPYFIIDLEQAFRRHVVDDFIDSYLQGLTPNPCVRCNEYVRFTLFFEELKNKLMQEKILAPDQEFFFATGHYVQTVQTENGWFIKKGRDPLKDQSYMLYRLPPAVLPHLVFPLGDMLKKDVVEIARKNNFTVAEEKESQDACFVDDDYVEFIIKATGRKDFATPGKIVDLQGTVRGEHQGYIRYTTGQRRGLGLGDGPWYVAEVRPKENLVVVARRDEAGQKEFPVGQMNWFINPPVSALECSVKIRYQSRDICARITTDESGRVRVILDSEELVTPGQSAVFYLEDLVIGGGVIERGIVERK